MKDQTITLYRSLTWEPYAKIRKELDERAETLRKLKLLPLTSTEITQELVLTPEEEQGLAEAPEDWNRPPTEAEIDEMAKIDHANRHGFPAPHEL